MEHESSLPASVVLAAIRLLGDEDPNVAAACRRRLVRLGAAARPFLLRAVESDDARLRVRARAVLRSIELQEWADGLAALARTRVPRVFDRTDWLETALLRVAEVGALRTVDRAAVEERLAALGRALEPLVAGRSSLTAARQLARLLGEEFGFAGRPRSRSVDDVCLDRVLARRRGSPAAMAALYIVIGRRAGLRMSAVRLRDYFLVRLHGRRRVLLDPFHRGRSVTRTDCLRFLRDTGAPGVGLTELIDVDDCDLLIGLLDNLVRIHDRSQHGEMRSAFMRARWALSRRGWESRLA